MHPHVPLTVAAAVVPFVVGAVLPALAPLANAQDAGGRSVVFVVTDGDGAPVSGAEVGLWNDDDVVDAQTGKDGRARLEDLAPGPWTAWIAAEGYTGEEQDAVVRGDRETELRFTLGPGVAFSGRVVDDAGAPVEDAYVEALAGGTFEGYSEVKSRPPYAREFTAPDGIFRIRGIPPGAVSTLVVTSDGMAEARVAVRAQGGTVRPRDLTIVLDRGGVIVGRVVDPAGAPWPEALVFVVPADEPTLIANPRIRRFGDDGMVAAITARADAEGAFEIIGLPFGEPLVAIAEARGFARSPPSRPLTPSAAARLFEVTLELRRPATLVVRLEDGEGGAVTTGSVRIGEVFEFGPETEEPDADGMFRLEGLSDGDVTVHVESPGFMPQKVEARLIAGETTELVVAMDRGATVAGVVRDESGAPVAGVDVALDYEITDEDGGWSSGTAGSAKTDAEGRFSIGGLRRSPHTLRARRGDTLKLPAEIAVDPPQTELEIVVRRTGSLRVRFLSPDDALPVPDRAFVWRYPKEPAEGLSGMGSGEPIDDGVLVLGDGRGEPERVRVEFDAFLPFEREVEIGWGEQVDLGDVTLDPGTTLRGRLLDLAGAPVAGALVSWDGLREAVSDDAGIFVLRHVPPGAVPVSVEAEGFLELEATVEPTDDGDAPALTLHRGALVTARLVDGDGDLLKHHWLQFRRPPTDPADPKGEHLADVGTRDDGRFEVRLPAGPCRALFIEDDAITVLAELDLVEGGTETLDLVLERE